MSAPGGRPPGRRARRRARAGASLQALRRGHPATSPPSSPSPTTAARAAGCATSWASLPPGDLRMALAALAGDDGWGRTWERPAAAPVRAATGRWPATPSATCCSPRSPRPRATSSPRSTWSAGCWAAPAGCCRRAARRWTSTPRSSASTPTSRRVTVVAARSRSRRRRGHGVGVVARSPHDAAGLRGGGAGGPGRRLGGARARARGSPACCPTCWCRTCATRSRRPPPGALVALNLAPQAGETDGLLARGPPRRAAGPRPGAAARRRARRRGCGRGHRVVSNGRGRRPPAAGSCSPTSPMDDGTPRHDPGRLGAAYRLDLHRRSMAMTAAVKDELSRLTVTRPCCRKAEMAALLRFAGGLHLVAGEIVVEAELDTGSHRAAAAQGDRRGLRPRQRRARGGSPGGLRKGNRYVVRVSKDGDGLARQTGLVDGHGRPVRGLPPSVVSGGTCDAAAAWRGAFLAHGSLTEPGRSSSLEITCPGPGGRAGAGRRGPPARRAGQGARGARRSTGSSSATATRSACCSPGWARTRRCWPGRTGGCAARCGPRPTGWPTSTTPTCAAPPGRRSRPGARVERALRDPRRRRPRAPAGRGSAAPRARQRLARGARCAGRPADDQGRGRRADPAAAGAWPTSGRPTSASPTPRPPSRRTCSRAPPESDYPA